MQESLPFTSWYWTYECDSSFVQESTESLRNRGIDLISAANPLERKGSGVIFFSKCSDQLLEEVERLAYAQVFALCVATPDSAIPSSFVWQLLQAGATDVLTASAPQSTGQIAARLERRYAVEQCMQSDAVAGTLVGVSPAWQRMLRQVVEVAHFTMSPVLILGETGTGKELLSRLIHELDARNGKRDLVTVDCTTIVPELSGSELFGHEKGAYTGAINSRDGAFSLAHNGTLFLDEVGELTPPLQAQLLRAVQEKTYKRVGGNAWNKTEFRLVCATNRDLAADVTKGLFRSDLYFRLASCVFRLPPLKERRADILPLARHFLGSVLDYDSEPQFDPAVAEYLESRDYPGNVRELRQLVLQMGQRHVGPGPITAGDLPAEEWPRLSEAAARRWPDAAFEEAIRRGLSSGAELRQINQAAADTAIRITVQSEEGNLQRAAKRLGITDRALQLRRASGQW